MVRLSAPNGGSQRDRARIGEGRNSDVTFLSHSCLFVVTSLAEDKPRGGFVGSGLYLLSMSTRAISLLNPSTPAGSTPAQNV